MKKFYLNMIVTATCFVLGTTLYNNLNSKKVMPTMESSIIRTFNIEGNNKGYNVIQGFGRDLSYYDISREYFDGLLAQSNEQNEKQEIRKFIWEHFTSHRRGYLRITVGGWEGQKLTQHLFIEPDSKGYWQLNWVYFENTDCQNGLCNLKSFENLTVDCGFFDTNRSSECCGRIIIKNKNGQIHYRF